MESTNEMARKARNEYQRHYRSTMTDAQRKRAYDRTLAWRRAHPERIRQYNAAYWRKRAERIHDR